jgi:hypothetical protein
MRHLDISHITEYRFSQPVSLLPHRLLLRPRENHNVRIESSNLEIFPAHTLQWNPNSTVTPLAEPFFCVHFP